MKNRHILFLPLLLLLTTCIDPIGVSLNEPVSHLVVDGLITSAPGPYTVKLTKTAQYSTGSEGTNYLVPGAYLSITDDAGNTEFLEENSPGIYTTKPNGIQGQIGRSYTLHIETAEGIKYESRPELIRATSGVDTAYYEFIEEAPGIQEGFYVYVDTKDPANTEDYYRWEWIYYKPISYCYVDENTALTCCTKCWDIFRCYGCVNIASDQLTDGSTISRQLLSIVPYDSKRDYYLYYVQYSLSRDAYKFWKALDDQVNNVGGIFDKPPATIRGNMFNVNDPDDVVLGYFGASDAKDGYLIVKRDGVAKNPPLVLEPSPPSSGPPPACVICEESAIRTAITPPLWPD